VLAALRSAPPRRTLPASTLDFGNQLPGADRWLEIGARTNGAAVAFTTLSPRRKINSAPYATTTANVSGNIPASQITGVIPLARLPAQLVTNDATGLNLTGTFTGDGSGLTNLTVHSPSGRIESLPFTITNPGVFYLTANLVGTAGQSGITVQADNVT